jgi:ankyrin repeat protein
MPQVLEKTKQGLVNIKLPIIHKADLHQELENAVRKNNLEYVQILLDNGVSPDCRSGRVIYTACQQGLTEIAELLIGKSNEYKGDKNFSNKCLKAYLELKQAVDVGLIKCLVENGADPKAVDNYGKSVLHFALENKANLEVIKYLIASGADPNAVNEMGSSVLHIAAENNVSLEVVKYLVEKGADLKAVDKNSRAVLHFATAKGNLEVVKYLVDKGADPKAADRYGWSVLHSAFEYQASLEVIKYLVDKGTDPKAVYKGRCSVLHIAVENNVSLEVVKYLVEQGADLKAVDEDGRSVLHFAAQYEANLEVIKYLVDLGADPKAIDEDGQSVLHIAVVNDANLEVIKYLVDLGADPKAVDKDGWSVLHFAIPNDANLEVIKYLVNLGADPKAEIKEGTYKVRSVLHLALQYEANLEVIKYLVEKGADPEAIDNDGQSVLHFAVENHTNLEVINYLLEQGAVITDEIITSCNDTTVKNYLTTQKTLLSNPNNLSKVNLINEKLKELELKELDQKLITQLTNGSDYSSSVFVELCRMVCESTKYITEGNYNYQNLYKTILINTIKELNETIKTNSQFKVKDYIEQMSKEVGSLSDFNDIIKKVANEYYLPMRIFGRVWFNGVENIRALSEKAVNAYQKEAYSQAYKALTNDRSLKELIRLNKFMHRPIATVPVELKPYIANLVWTGLLTEEVSLSSGYSMKSLASQEELALEGHILRHCVGNGNYATECSLGNKQILSLILNGQSVATIELGLEQNNTGLIRTGNKSWKENQFKGVKNENPTNADREAFGEFVEKINQTQSLINPEAVNYRGVDTAGFNSMLSPIERAIGIPLNEPELFERIIAHYRELEKSYRGKILR